MLATISWIWFFLLSLDFLSMKLGLVAPDTLSEKYIFIVFIPTWLLGMFTLNPAIKVVGRDLFGFNLFRRMWTSSPLPVKILIPAVFGNAMYLMFASPDRQTMMVLWVAISMWLSLVSAICASYILRRR